ncbi:MAG: hypothetical protein U0802_05710 [Candidatus Binatia bacterium]
MIGQQAQQPVTKAAEAGWLASSRVDERGTSNRARRIRISSAARYALVINKSLGVG